MQRDDFNIPAVRYKRAFSASPRLRASAVKPLISANHCQPRIRGVLFV